MATRKKRGVKLIGDVGKFGLMTGLAKSRARLVASTVAANCLMGGFGVWVADYVNHGSSSVFLNLCLIAASMMSLLVCSYLDSMLIGDLFFPGSWRERVLLGKRVNALDDDGALQAAAYKNFSLAFIIVLGLGVVTNYFALDAVTGDYMEEYHRAGFQLTQLRSDSGTDKIAAMREMAKAIHRDDWENPDVREAISRELANKDPKVLRWAAWTAGKMHLREMEPTLIGLAEKGDPVIRAEAATAIGRTAGDGALRFFVRALADKSIPNQVAIGVLRGCALLGDKGAGDAIMAITSHPDPEVMAYAYWALGAIGHKGSRRALLERVKSRKGEERCMVLEALKHVVVPEDGVYFKRLFLTETPGRECAWRIWEDYDKAQQFICYKETSRAKLMKIVHNARPDDSELKGWYLMVASDKQEPYALRQLATQLHKLHSKR